MSRKNPLIMVAVLIVAGGAAAYFWQHSNANPKEPTNQPVIYKNAEYGFSFALPDSWRNYSIVNSKWEGDAVGPNGNVPVEYGPIISIRHPQWTPQNPRQDIPIMVFTPAQWTALSRDEFHIGAAPIGPTKLGSNSDYVFALPARYNFAFPTGFEEVEKILETNPLQSLPAPISK